MVLISVTISVDSSSAVRPEGLRQWIITRTPQGIEPGPSSPWPSPSTDYVSPLCLNPLTPNDHYSDRTAPLTSKRCILYIYSKNTGTEYFKRGIYSPFFLFKVQFVS